MNQNSFFVPGARVAVISNLGRAREAFVEKVYKNGNFILRDDKNRQQWRPHTAYNITDHKSADPAGSRSIWNSEHIRLWDDESNAELTVKVEREDKRKRLDAVASALRKMRPDDIAMADLQQIEDILRDVAKE